MIYVLSYTDHLEASPISGRSSEWRRLISMTKQPRISVVSENGESLKSGLTSFFSLNLNDNLNALPSPPQKKHRSGTSSELNLWDLLQDLNGSQWIVGFIPAPIHFFVRMGWRKPWWPTSRPSTTGVIFHSYVRLPEGTSERRTVFRVVGFAHQKILLLASTGCFIIAIWTCTSEEHTCIWLWINTYRYSLLGDEHPFATYFDVHQGYMVLTHSHMRNSKNMYHVAMWICFVGRIFRKPLLFNHQIQEPNHPRILGPDESRCFPLESVLLRMPSQPIVLNPNKPWHTAQWIVNDSSYWLMMVNDGYWWFMMANDS